VHSDAATLIIGHVAKYKNKNLQSADDGLEGPDGTVVVTVLLGMRNVWHNNERRPGDHCGDVFFCATVAQVVGKLPQHRLRLLLNSQQKSPRPAYRSIFGAYHYSVQIFQALNRRQLLRQVGTFRNQLIGASIRRLIGSRLREMVGWVG
jgi:hypothetical protein